MSETTAQVKIEFASPGVVQDVLAYLLLAQDPWDDLAFRRICNKPTRGIGPVTEDAVVDHALRSNLTLYDALIQIAEAGKRRTFVREGLDRLADCLSWLVLGYSHKNWVTDEFLDVILLEGGVGYEKFALARSRKGDDVASTIQALRAWAAQEPNLTLFLERFPAEWQTLPRQVEALHDICVPHHACR